MLRETFYLWDMEFYKYQGTGNDFVVIDNRQLNWVPTPAEVSAICHRRFGVGGDGLILLEGDEETSFYMNYFNSDGTQSFCGNGSRVAVRFAESLGLIEGNHVAFRAIDGFHEAVLQGDTIKVRMRDVESVDKRSDGNFFVNTGSPHVLSVVPDIQAVDVREMGRSIRYSDEFRENGVNVNFIQWIDDNEAFIRTYERGVEDETFSCGTGVTAAALVLHAIRGVDAPKIIRAVGGELSVELKRSGAGYEEVWLGGPAVLVFKGEYTHEV